MRIKLASTNDAHGHGLHSWSALIIGNKSIQCNRPAYYDDDCLQIPRLIHQFIACSFNEHVAMEIAQSGTL